MAFVKMIILDLDGTLIRSDKSISERTLKTLRQCQDRGIIVVIATARFWIGAEKYIRMIHPDYEITTDGTMIHRGEDMVYSCGMDLQTTHQLIRMIQAADAHAEITDAGKLQAIRALASSLHISMEQLAAFGDDENDLEMLKACGRGIAVANGLESVKAAADEVCESNDSDGVAKWLETNVLGL